MPGAFDRPGRSSLRDNPWLRPAALIVALVAAGFLIDRTLFVLHAERTTGVVTNLGARTRLRGGYEFSASVQYVVGGARLGLGGVYAGTARTREARRAIYQVGQRVDVVYDPEEPHEAFVDRFQDVWGGPLTVSLIGVAILFGIARLGAEPRFKQPSSAAEDFSRTLRSG